MSKDFTPVKTEYMGTVFDSKSEAVFARVLHALGHDYVYHPNKHCDHEWDFLVFRKAMFEKRTYASVGSGHYISKIMYDVTPPPILIEYKPSAPTETYIGNITRKTSAKPIESVIVWGNPWAGPPNLSLMHDLSYVVYPVFTTHGRYGWGDFCSMADNGGADLPFSNRHTFGEMFGCSNDRVIQDAVKYRFDLRSGGSV